MMDNKQALKVFITVVLYTIMCVLSIEFKKNRTSNNLDTLAFYPGYRSSLECATKCALKRNNHPMCAAFSFNPRLHICFIYNTTYDEHKEVEGVYVYEQHCDTSDGFQEIWKENKMFCYAFISDVQKSYFDASTHCSSLGGYLLNFETSIESDVVKSILTRGNTWVGATDIAIKDNWLTDKDGTPTSDSWNWYPLSGPYDARCAQSMVNSGVIFIIKVLCSNHATFICERTI